MCHLDDGVAGVGDCRFRTRPISTSPYAHPSSRFHFVGRMWCILCAHDGVVRMFVLSSLAM
jgi:hypothetical protein